jgi:DNA polymerase I-like protein with 3'-5' exonuclease and polymerase domains
LISSNVVLDPDRLAREVEYFGNQGEFVWDYETIDSSPGADDRGVPSQNVVTWLGMATRGRTIMIPMGHPIGTKVIGEVKEPRQQSNGIKMFRVPVYEKPPEQMTRSDVFPLVNKLFNDPGIDQAGHGVTFDAATHAKYNGGNIPAGDIFCTLVMRWITDENRMRYGLKYIAKDIWGMAYDDENVGRQVEKHPFNKVAHYLFMDLQMCWLEYERNKAEIERQGLGDVLALETELVSTLAHMRTVGVKIDVERLHQLRDELSVRVAEQERNVWAAAGKQFNLNAPMQKQAVLFKSKAEGGRGIKPWKMTDGGKKKAALGHKPDHSFYSTDAEALDSFRSDPVVDALLDYQESSKVYGTYVLGYLGDETAKDKPNRIFNERIYPDFVQYGAATGRFSCRDPNLQNVPAPRTDLGKMVRGLFVADLDWDLCVADYGQIELVILADQAYKRTGHKGALWRGFHQGIDPHTMTAAMVLGKDPADVIKDERQRFGKSMNFAVVYGAGPRKVASMAGINVPQAKELLRIYDQKFPEVGELRRIILKEAKRHSSSRTGFPPHVETMLGRMRRLPGLNSTDDGLRMYNERQAFNALVQGSSADMTKMAMNRFMKRKAPHWELLLTVHDELVATAPKADSQDLLACLVESMTGDAMQELISVPLTVDAKIVTRWADAK